MTLVRTAIGYVILGIVYILSTVCVGLVKVSAWLLDREEYEKKIHDFIKQREEEHPVPSFEDEK